MGWLVSGRGKVYARTRAEQVLREVGKKFWWVPQGSFSEKRTGKPTFFKGVFRLCF